MKESSTLTAGIDISDRTSRICIIDEQGAVLEESKVRTTREAATQCFASREPMLIALEVGTHSPWMSHLLEELGHEVVVANPRKLRLIYENEDKRDEVDAEMIARVARMDRKLLCPVVHRGEEAQTAMALVRSRDSLVRARTMLVNHTRGMVKSTGERLRTCSAASFHRLEGELPEQLGSALRPVMAVIAELGKRIREIENEIERVSRERFPETALMRDVHGVGAVTALAFALTIEDPARFPQTRAVGAYLGLVPRRDQSGERDPQLSITRAGNIYLRRLLVSAAHRIVGPFGPDSDLRRFGLKKAASGGKRAKKRAVIAVARKLAVLLLTLWKNGEVYEPLRQERRCAASAA
jgi:transposase